MRTRLWLLMSFSALSATCSAATAKDAVVMHIVHTAPLDHQITLALHAFALDVEERTKGDVVVDGQTDPALEAELRAEVARARRTLGAPRRGAFDLDEPTRMETGGQAREPSGAPPRSVGAPPRAARSPSLTDPAEP